MFTKPATEKKTQRKHQAAYRNPTKPFFLQFFLHFFTLNSKSLRLLLFVCVVAALGLWLLQPQQLSLRQVDIEVLDTKGQRDVLKQLSMVDVQQTLKPLAQGNMLWLDLAAIQQVLMQLDWVQSAQVRRRWPDTLHVQLREQQAVAYWQTLTSKKHMQHGLLNQHGELFLVTPQAIPEDLALPRLHGVLGSQLQVLRNYQFLRKPLQGTGLSIKSLQFDAHQNWRVWLEQSKANDNNTAWLSVSLGEMPIMARWQQFLKLYQTHLSSHVKTMHTVDLRYEQGMSVAY